MRRLRAVYPPCAIRARRWHPCGDMRGYVPPRVWAAVAGLLDVHPITGRSMEQSSWWIVETKRRRRALFSRFAEQHAPP